MSPALMHTNLKSPALIQTLAHFLQNGFALQPTLTGEAAEKAVMPLLDSLGPTATPMHMYERYCRELLQNKSVRCFRIFDDIDDVPQFKATVPKKFLVFFGSTLANIGIADYLAHIIPRLHCSEEAIIMAVVYIARAVKKGVPFTPRSAHRMIAAALLVAIKTHDERQYPMQRFGRVTGYPCDRLLTLEGAMLDVLEFATFVSPAEYTAMLYTIKTCHYQQRHPQFGTWTEVTMDIEFPAASQWTVPAARITKEGAVVAAAAKSITAKKKEEDHDQERIAESMGIVRASFRDLTKLRRQNRGGSVTSSLGRTLSCITSITNGGLTSQGSSPSSSTCSTPITSPQAL